MKHESFGFYHDHIASSRIKALSKMEHLYLVILAGGEGLRLFPYSNLERPKQLCHIDGGDRNKDTFLKRTITNFVDCGFDRNHIMVVTSSERQLSATRHQAANPGGVPIKNVWRIPAICGPAGTMVEATRRIAELDSEAIVVNTPSDHYLVPNHQFIGAVLDAVNYAEQGFVCEVGSVSHNTGIIAWRAADFLVSAPTDTENLNLNQLQEVFKDNYKLTVGDFEWKDCDTFQKLYQALDKSSRQNVLLGEGEYKLDNSCHHSLFYVDKGLTLSACDVANCAVIFTMIEKQPVLLVANLSEDQTIKELAEEFSLQGRLVNSEATLSVQDNQVLYSNLKDNSSVGFVSVSNFVTYIHRRCDYGTIEAEVFKRQKS